MVIGIADISSRSSCYSTISQRSIYICWFLWRILFFYLRDELLIYLNFYHTSFYVILGVRKWYDSCLCSFPEGLGGGRRYCLHCWHCLSYLNLVCNSCGRRENPLFVCTRYDSHWCSVCSPSFYVGLQLSLQFLGLVPLKWCKQTGLEFLFWRAAWWRVYKFQKHKFFVWINNYLVSLFSVFISVGFFISFPPLWPRIIWNRWTLIISTPSNFKSSCYGIISYEKKSFDAFAFLTI